MFSPLSLLRTKKQKKDYKILDYLSTGTALPNAITHAKKDSRLTDGGEVVSPTRRQPFTPRKIPGTHFC
jgi:hypothetical protein